MTTTICCGIPDDVWTEVALQWLDARDLMNSYAAVSAAAAPPSSTKVEFVAARILREDELDWFAARGILVALLVERSITSSAITWRRNGQLHRDGDLPAVENCSGGKVWCQDGEQHRDNDQPAVEYSDGSKIWYQRGKLHRDNGQPAVVLTNDSGKFILPMSKSVQLYNGDKAWYRHGVLHRDGGLPAIERGDGSREWWINGELLLFLSCTR